MLSLIHVMLVGHACQVSVVGEACHPTHSRSNFSTSNLILPTQRPAPRVLQSSPVKSRTRMTSMMLHSSSALKVFSDEFSLPPKHTQSSANLSAGSSHQHHHLTSSSSLAYTLSPAHPIIRSWQNSDRSFSILKHIIIHDHGRMSAPARVVSPSELSILALRPGWRVAKTRQPRRSSFTDSPKLA